MTTASELIALAERRSIVAWLRGGYETLGQMCDASEAEQLADAIERGDHLRAQAAQREG